MHKTGFLTYLDHLKKYSSLTIESYAHDLNQFYSFCLKNNFIICEDEIITDSRLVRKWINSLSGAGISSVSINRKISCLNSFYNYLIRNGQISKSPMTKIVRPKISKKLPDFIREENIDKFLESEVLQNEFTEVRDRLVIELLYSTGIRRAELIGLKFSDVDLKSQTIKVTGKRNKQRIIPFPMLLNHTLELYIRLRDDINAQTDFLIVTNFGKASYPNLIYRIVKKHLSNVTNGKKRSPHVLRHSYATHLLNKGADINAVKELLGHSNLAATQVYTHNTFEKLNRIYKQAHPRAKK
jgi:integrase/recombinase XerC